MAMRDPRSVKSRPQSGSRGPSGPRAALADPAQLIARAVHHNGQTTRLALEEAFWAEFDAAARDLGVPPSLLLGAIDAERGAVRLPSAVRVFVFEYVYRAATGRDVGRNARSVLARVRRLHARH